MFAQPPRPGRSRWNLSLTFSVAFHFVVLTWLALPPAPIFVKPKLIVRGDRGTSLTYLAKQEVNEAPVAQADHALVFPRLPVRVSQPRKINPKALKHPKKPAAQIAEKIPAAGSPYGSLFQGDILGSEVLPAIPINFPDPPISRSELTPGIQGDVVVEITIDTQGNITDKKLLQTIGYGIEEKILATLANWRFKPATKDGIAIASKQDVHFHFPS